MEKKAIDLNEYEECFHTIPIAPHTWQISSRCPATPFGSDNYLLEGDFYSICIDSGMTKLDICSYAQLFTDKPIDGVINTHAHFDHTGGNGWFRHVYMMAGAEKAAKTPFGGSTEGYKLDYPIIPISEGYEFDLGNRKLEIIEIGAHNLYSIAILDKTYRILFSGDELESGWCNVGAFGNDKVKGETIENHYHNMLKLKDRWDEFDVICPAHHGAPLSKELLSNVITCDKMILDGYEGSRDNPPKNGGGMMPKNPDMRVMRYKCAHIGYNVNHIFDDK
jgi:hydroxyacylglutathione hydrolase